MADTKTVIKGLRHCVSSTCTGCPYRHVGISRNCVVTLKKDAIELLKKQEPIKPKRTVDEHGQVLSCGNCGAWFKVQSQKYCHECGQEVKWDG